MHQKHKENAFVELKIKIKQLNTKKIMINQKCPFFNNFSWKNFADFSSLLLVKIIEITKKSKLAQNERQLPTSAFWYHKKQEHKF